VRTQDRLGVTVTAPGKQFEGTAAVRIGAAVVVWPSHRCATMISALACLNFGPRMAECIAQCLNLEHEFHHTVSKLCILGFEPLK
jgi:hypothetical protein